MKPLTWQTNMTLSHGGLVISDSQKLHSSQPIRLDLAMWQSFQNTTMLQVHRDRACLILTVRVPKEVIVKQNRREDVEDVEMREEVEMWR